MKPKRHHPRTKRQLRMTIIEVWQTKRPARFPNGVIMTPNEAREIIQAGIEIDESKTTHI